MSLIEFDAIFPKYTRTHLAPRNDTHLVLLSPTDTATPDTEKRHDSKQKEFKNVLLSLPLWHGGLDPDSLNNAGSTKNKVDLVLFLPARDPCLLPCTLILAPIMASVVLPNVPVGRDRLLRSLVPCYTSLCKVDTFFPPSTPMCNELLHSNVNVLIPSTSLLPCVCACTAVSCLSWR